MSVRRHSSSRAVGQGEERKVAYASRRRWRSQDGSSRPFRNASKPASSKPPVAGGGVIACTFIAGAFSGLASKEKSEILGTQPRLSGNPRKHLGPNLSVIMKGGHVIGPVRALEDAVGAARLAFHNPTDPKQSREDTPRLD